MEGSGPDTIDVVVSVATAGSQIWQPPLDRLQRIGPELGDRLHVNWEMPEPQPGFEPAAGFAAESVALVALGLTLGGFLNQLGAAAADGLIGALKRLFRRTAEESARNALRIRQAQIITADHSGRSIAVELVEGILIELGGDGTEAEHLVEERLRELPLVRDELLRQLDERIADDSTSSDYVVKVSRSGALAIDRIADVNDLLPRVDR
jgi:hypothetical protein